MHHWEILQDGQYLRGDSLDSIAQDADHTERGTQGYGGGGDGCIQPEGVSQSV